MVSPIFWTQRTQLFSWWWERNTYQITIPDFFYKVHVIRTLPHLMSLTLEFTPKPIFLQPGARRDTVNICWLILCMNLFIYYFKLRPYVNKLITHGNLSSWHLLRAQYCHVQHFLLIYMYYIISFNPQQTYKVDLLLLLSLPFNKLRTVSQFEV